MTPTADKPCCYRAGRIQRWLQIDHGRIQQELARRTTAHYIQKSCEVGRRTISLMSTSAGCSMA
jgi:hypothetical protein